MKSRIRIVEAARACKWDLMAAGTVLFAQEEKPFGAGDESSAWTGDVYISTNGWMDGWRGAHGVEMEPYLIYRRTSSSGPDRLPA